MVAGRRTDHTLFQLFRLQVRHLVVGAAQLEAEHRLLVLAFQQHPVVQAAAQVLRGFKGRLDGHVINARGQNFLQIVGWLERFLGLGRCSLHGFPSSAIIEGAPEPKKKAPNLSIRGQSTFFRGVEETNGA
jgi:hypothetical protein